MLYDFSYASHVLTQGNNCANERRVVHVDSGSLSIDERRAPMIVIVGRSTHTVTKRNLSSLDSRFAKKHIVPSARVVKFSLKHLEDKGLNVSETRGSKERNSTFRSTSNDIGARALFNDIT